MSYFKRDSETIGNAKKVLLADNLTAEQRKAIEQLVIDYEKSTFDKWEDRHEFYRNVVDDMVNDCNFRYMELAERMANNHPTLQQNFMRMCSNFIMRMAEKTYCDDRNRTSVEYAKSIMDNVGEEHFAHI